VALLFILPVSELIAGAAEAAVALAKLALISA
jgi:hypothetical protein